MSTSNASALPQGLGQIFGPGTAIGLDEGRLIGRFVESNDASAFEAIVARHGPMVLGVCRRSLRDPNDAADAFQATFLIFARRAGSIRDPSRLGGWLHGVAYRVAFRARREAARRPSVEADAIASDGPAAGDDLDRRERADLLHGEIERLPDRYRQPVVLCHLEGCTHEEAAERLGWPVGTVRGRLARGRDRLRERLTRRGMASAAVPPALMPVPASVAATTAKAATALAAGRSAVGLATSARVAAWLEGVSRTMMTFELKMIALKSLAVALAATTGAGAYALSRGGAEPGPAEPPSAVGPEQAPSRPETPRGRLQPAADWGGGGNGYELGIDEAVKRSGRSSGSIRSVGDSPGAFGTLTQGFQAAAYRGKRLKLSAQVKAEGIEKQSGLWLRVDGKRPAVLAFDNMEDRPIKGTADWKKYEVVLDIPEEAEEIYFGFLLAGKGRAWVDDITFEATGKGAAPAVSEAPPPRHPGGTAPALPAEPKNLGFER